MKNWLTLKKGCFLISAASLSLAPNRFSGFLRNNYSSGGKWQQFGIKHRPACRWLNVLWYLSHDWDSLWGEEPWVSDIIVDNRVKHLLLILTREWRLQGSEHKKAIKNAPITTIVKINVTGQKCYWLKLTNNSYLSNKHFIDEHAKTPPVHSSGVGDICQHFRSKELWCATECASSSAVPHVLLAKTKIGYLDKTLSV